MEEKHVDVHPLDEQIGSDPILQDGVAIAVPGELTMSNDLVIKRTNARVKRHLLLVLGIVLFALGGLFFYCSGIGMDPLSVFYGGVATVLNIRIGTAAFLISVILLVLLIFMDRSRIGIGTVAVSLGIGPLLNLFIHFFSYVPVGWITAIFSSIAGLLCYSTAMACYLHADLGAGSVDAIMLYVVDRTSLKLGMFKVLFDALSVGIGWLLGGVIGVGTVLAVFFSGPLMSTIMELLENGSFKQRAKEKLQ